MPRLLFAKTGNAVWISHLDLMRVFQRAFRRGGILIRHSQGFTPGLCLHRSASRASAERVRASGLRLAWG
ncbi:MAG: DUF2344 domain-containing protein [Oscillospiraceae bacterium]